MDFRLAIVIGLIVTGFGLLLGAATRHDSEGTAVVVLGLIIAAIGAIGYLVNRSREI